MSGKDGRGRLLSRFEVPPLLAAMKAATGEGDDEHRIGNSENEISMVAEESREDAGRTTNGATLSPTGGASTRICWFVARGRSTPANVGEGTDDDTCELGMGVLNSNGCIVVPCLRPGVGLVLEEIADAARLIFNKRGYFWRS